jgi:hypothetical protein
LNAWKPLSDGIDSEFKQYVWIDRWDNKEYTRPDVLDFTFNAEGSAEKLAEGKTVFSWAQFAPTSDSTGTKQTVACSVQIGAEDPVYSIYNYEGTSGWSDNEVYGVSLSDLKSGEVMSTDNSGAFRESYSDGAYDTYTWDSSDGST